MLAVVLQIAFVGSAGAIVIRSPESVETHSGQDVEFLRSQYLSTVRMGLLGGLNHAAFVDPNRGATTDPGIRNECLIKDWMSGRTLDNCIMKWDANERLLRIHDLYEKVRAEGIPGDLMECGVWRGGVTVYMKALTRAYSDESRRVWVSDSFNGVPNAARQDSENLYQVPEDVKRMDRHQWGGNVTERDPAGQIKVKNILTVEHELVRDNFVRFGLLDDQVRFLPGYFNESLPEVTKQGLKELAVLRVDGDLYTSTMDVLLNLYDFVSPGGYIVFDDYPLPQSRRAIEDFFHQKGLDLNLIKTDRITPEDTTYDPKSLINRNAYFQKPRASQI